MPGFFQTANSQGEFFLNSSNYDTVIRATGTSERIILGCVHAENDYSTNCSMIITPSEITVNGSLNIINGNINGNVNGNTGDQNSINLGNLNLDNSNIDRNNIIGVDATGNTSLVSVSNDNHSDFLSLFGVKPKNTEFISGLFDLGSLNWQNEWSIDEVLFNESLVLPDITNSIETSDILSFKTLISSNKTSCLDFKQNLNISLYDDKGNYQSNLAIYVNDELREIQNNDKFLFIGRLLPDNMMFANKFQGEFIRYFLKYGYKPYLDQDNPTKYIRLPSEKSHIPGTKFYIVEFINTYSNFEDDCYYQIGFDYSDRKNKYVVTNNDVKMVNDTDVHHGLYPTITYTRWLNVENPDKVQFRDHSYTSDIWGDLLRDEQDVKNEFYSSHDENDENGWMYKLYELTYLFIKYGKESEHLTINANTPVGMDSHTLFSYFENNVVSVSGHNIIFESRVNMNDHVIDNNINSVTYKHSAFPDEMFFE